MTGLPGATNDPLARFHALFERAQAAEGASGRDATAAALATADVSGRPSVRMVLLKGAVDRGFVFYTSYESAKAGDLEANPRAALCFHWPTLAIQVRVEGGVERVPAGESDAYFATRPRESQLAAWASRQSAPLSSREALLARYREAELRFGLGPVPRPPFWGGYRLWPMRIEFWRGDEHRLHHRDLYVRGDEGWTITSLSP